MDLTQLNPGSVCEVRTMENDLLIVGRLSQMEDGVLEIVSSNGEKMLPAACNTPVKVNIYNSQAGLMIFGGKVFIGSEEFWRIRDLQQFSASQGRSHFRMKVTVQATVCRFAADGTVQRPGYPIHFVDVSLGGALIACREDFALQERLRLEEVWLRPDTLPFNFTCRVQRMAGRGPQGKLYGCSFIDLSQTEQDRLCGAIFALQREELKKRRNRL